MIFGPLTNKNNIDINSILPSGGTAGQVLKKTATGATWSDDNTFSGDYNDLTNKPDLDLSLFTVVEELPTTDINDEKIYLVKSTVEDASGMNTFIEYVHTDEGWEEFGEYKTDIDLSNYVEKEDGKGLFSGNYNDLTNKPTITQYSVTLDI